MHTARTLLQRECLLIEVGSLWPAQIGRTYKVLVRCQGAVHNRLWWTLPNPASAWVVVGWGLGVFIVTFTNIQWC